MKNPSILIVDRIEELLGQYYGFSPLVKASEHMLSKDECADNKTHVEGDGAVLVDSAQEDELFISMFIADKVLHVLDVQNPLQNLNEANLHAFCVGVEETSHFHLIVNRASRNQPVTQLELEWQAEIDKLLLSSHLLAQQKRHLELNALMQRLYDQAVIVAANEQRYKDATKMAVQFWNTVSANLASGVDPLENKFLKAKLRSAYDLSLHEKIARLSIAA